MNTPTTRRPLWIALTATTTAAILVAGGWLAAATFVSPAQRDAAASAPPPGPVLATVERGDLVDRRLLPGQIRSAGEDSAALAPVAEASRSIVTSVAAGTGATVEAGSMLATVNGHPVFALRSDFPMYRDLGVGDSGPDVLALQQNLVGLGLLSRADGAFGSATATAVAKLYARTDHAAPTRPRTADRPTAPPPEAEGDASATPVTPPPPRDTYLPLWSSLPTRQLPAVVTAAPTVGAQVGDGVAYTFSSAELAIVAIVSNDLARALAPGMHVTVTGAGLAGLAGTVSSVATSRVDGTAGGSAGAAVDGAAGGDTDTGTNSGSGSGSGSESEAMIALDDPAALTGEMRGAPITVEAVLDTVATGALLIPQIAIADKGGERGDILVKRPDGTFRTTRVKILGVVSGQAAIDGGDAVHEGDEVRLG